MDKGDLYDAGFLLGSLATVVACGFFIFASSFLTLFLWLAMTGATTLCAVRGQSWYDTQDLLPPENPSLQELGEKKALLLEAEKEVDEYLSGIMTPDVLPEEEQPHGKEIYIQPPLPW